MIAGLVVHASWRGGSAFWRYYKFEDGVRVTAQFSGFLSEAEIQNRVIEIAQELDVPIDLGKVDVRKEENHTFVNTSYTERIELVPTYFYPHRFTVNVDVFTVGVANTPVHQ